MANFVKYCLLILTINFIDFINCDSFNDCLQKDSILCLQNVFYRKAKDVFDVPKIDLFGGSLSLVKQNNYKSYGRSLENSIETTNDIESKQSALELWTTSQLGDFFNQRSLQLNLNGKDVIMNIKTAINSVPQTIREGIAAYFSNENDEEARGKKKKLLRSLMPFLLGLKMKLAGLAVLSVFVIALIAKKALLVSLLSLAVTGFIALKKFFSGGIYTTHHITAPHHEVHEVGHGWSGGYNSGGWDDSHGGYSNNVAQTIAYSGQKPA